MVGLPNNCRIALNTLVKIQTMVVKIINTVVEISNSQMLKYAGHSERRGLASASFRDLVQLNPFEQKREGFREVSFKSETADDQILKRGCSGNRQRIITAADPISPISI